MLKQSANDRRPFWIRYQALAHRARCIQVTEWSQECPSSAPKRLLHSGASSIGTHIVIELREGCKDAFHQFPGRCVVDWLRRRPKRDAQGLQVRAQCKVVVLVPREAG